MPFLLTIIIQNAYLLGCTSVGVRGRLGGGGCSVSVVLGVLYTVLKAFVYGRFRRFECRVEGKKRNFFMWRPEEKTDILIQRMEKSCIFAA